MYTMLLIYVTAKKQTNLRSGRSIPWPIIKCSFSKLLMYLSSRRALPLPALTGTISSPVNLSEISFVIFDFFLKVIETSFFLILFFCTKGNKKYKSASIVSNRAKRTNSYQLMYDWLTKLMLTNNKSVVLQTMVMQWRVTDERTHFCEEVIIKAAIV